MKKIIKGLVLTLLTWNLSIHTADTSWPNLTEHNNFKPLLMEFFTKDITKFFESITLRIENNFPSIRLNHDSIENIHKQHDIEQNLSDCFFKDLADFCPERLKSQLQNQGKNICDIMLVIRQKLLKANSDSHTFIFSYPFKETIAIKSSKSLSKFQSLLEVVWDQKEEGIISLEKIDKNYVTIIVITKTEKSSIDIRLDPITKKLSLYEKGTIQPIKADLLPTQKMQNLWTSERLTFSRLICARSCNDNELHLVPYF